MEILFAASECVPFIKTGGLADVAGAMPEALARSGETVKVILPLYGCIPMEYRAQMKRKTSYPILFGFGELPCEILSLEKSGVEYLFVRNDDFFGGDKVYLGASEDAIRFAFYCRCVAELIRKSEYYPDVVHLNDWQTGLIAAMLRTQYDFDPRIRRIRIVYAIHNLRYQGLCDWERINAYLGFDKRLYHPEYIEYYGLLSCAKAGLVFADRIVTVSPTYANEIQSPERGEGLDGLLCWRRGVLSGILNGIDIQKYDPATDKEIVSPYSAAKPQNKAVCKEALQKELGLAVDADKPIIAMVTRLTPQKGLDLVECVMEEILRLDAQLVLLGDGDEHYIELFRSAERMYPGKVATWFGMNESLAHRVYAGSDMFLMPSLFEPCGLSQLIALRYGCVPIVRETGGLKDTVIPYNQYTDEGNGFSFANYNAHEMLFTLERAVRYYHNDRDMWKRLICRGMTRNSGWDDAAAEYRKLYRKALEQ